MKEAIVSKGPVVEIVDSPIPEPNDDQVLIKVVVSGSNPKDWKLPEWLDERGNSGDDIAGIVEKVGKNVHEFQPGDRVAAFHEMRTPHGSFAEYAVAWAHTTFRIPPQTTFEEAATIPLAAMTSAHGLFSKNTLGLPQPWTPAKEEIPVVIYGAASAVGVYAIQLAKRANIHPLICVAGASVDYVETLIDRSKGDTLIDYRQGDDAVVAGLQKALAGRPLLHAFDAVADHGSYQNLSKVLAEGSTITLVLHGRGDDIPKRIRRTFTMVGAVHKDEDMGKDFGYVYFRYFARGLEEGWFKGQRQEIVPGGLGGVQTALENLKAEKANGVKYVFRIADTEGVGK